MNKVAHTVEDCLELLVGLQGQAKFQIDSSDQTILQSIARQVYRKIALTDRQHTLVKEKLLKYSDQFTALEYDLESALEALRMPLREIDRSKYVTVVAYTDIVGPNEVYESYKGEYKWIKVRFPFSKKLILLIEEIIPVVSTRRYFHTRGSHEHYFALHESSVYHVVNKLKDKNFIIDQELLDVYEKLHIMEEHKNNYIPGIYNYKLKNLSDRATKYMISSVGEPSVDTLALYKDRQELFGLHYFDQADLDTSLSQLSVLSKKIVTRNHTNVFVSKDKYTLNTLSESILELNRFPLLVVLPDNDPLSHLHNVHSSFKGFVDASETTVMFRLDNTSNAEFNDYIKRHNLNSPLDTTTKIVYINNSNIPKPLVMSDWRASAALMLSSLRPHTRIAVYLDSLDLVLQYDDNPSQMMRRNLDIL